MAKAKTKNPTDQEEKVAYLKQRIGFLKKFVQARRYVPHPPNGTLKRHCHRSYGGHLALKIPISGINPPILTRQRGDEHPCYFCRGVPVYQSLCSLPRSHFCLVTQRLLWFALLSCDKGCQFRYTFVFCRTYEENPEEAINQCHILLEEPDLETAVRVGDVYGVIIEHYARQQNYSKVSFRLRLCA